LAPSDALARALLGLLNGAAVTRFRMPPFSSLYWNDVLQRPGHLADQIREASPPAQPPLNALGGQTWLALAITTVAAVAAHVTLSRSVFGRWPLRGGHNRTASRISGVPSTASPSRLHRQRDLCSLASRCFTPARPKPGSPVLGQRILLDVIGATVIGGTSLFGGKGKILWTLFGVLFLKLIDKA